MDFRTIRIQPTFFGTKESSTCHVGDDEKLFKALNFLKKNKHEEARQIFKSLASHCNAEAQFQLGAMDLTTNPTQAFQHIESAAKQGHPQAIYQLGIMYETGQGVTKDDCSMPFWCFVKVADLLPSAKTRLGIGYLTRRYINEKSNERAFKCFSEAADSDPNAANMLGEMYLYADHYGWEQDYLKAHEHFLSAANQGNSRALYNLAIMYREGYGVDKNLLTSVRYLKEIVDKGEEYGLSELISIYENHPDILDKDVQAGSYYLKAADQENAQAQYRVGQWYDAANARSGTKLLDNREQAAGPLYRIGDSLAVPYLQRATEQGHVQAMRLLGDMYYFGRGVRVNYSLAGKYYLSVAAKGDQSIAPQLHQIGQFYKNNQAYLYAFDCFFCAAKLGNTPSLYALETMHTDNDLATRNEKQFLAYLDSECKANNMHALFCDGKIFGMKCTISNKHMHSAAEMGLTAAQLYLGHYYDSEARGTAENYMKAIQYYEAAAEKDPSAYLKLATLYKSGLRSLSAYTAPNGLKAIGCYNLAAKNGVIPNSEAYTNIAEILENGIGIPKDPTGAAKYREMAKADAQGDGEITVINIQGNPI